MRKMLALTLVILFPACGGGGGGSSRTPTQPAAPVIPAAVITATGAGALVLHPSLDTRFAIAMETPIRVAETAGGSADWSFARLQLFRGGAEIERTELTANDIRAAGVSRIGGATSNVYTVVFRFNSDTFDRIDMTLGFADARDGRSFTAVVPGNTFTSVLIGLNPLGAGRSPDPL
jgi:hypothetical protein